MWQKPMSQVGMEPPFCVQTFEFVCACRYKHRLVQERNRKLFGLVVKLRRVLAAHLPVAAERARSGNLAGVVLAYAQG